MNAAELKAGLSSLENCSSSNPHSLLGLHQQNKQWLLRIYQPDSDSVRVQSKTETVEASRLSYSHLFEVNYSQKPEEYRIEFKNKDGVWQSRHDAYCYSQLIAQNLLEAFSHGKSSSIDKFLGCNATQFGNVSGYLFAVWAPLALGVSVVADFNNWDHRFHPMAKREPFGVWELFIPDVTPGQSYCFRLRLKDGRLHDKIDPVAKEYELRPSNKALVPQQWKVNGKKQSWEEKRRTVNSLSAPISIYQVHIGTWAAGAKPEGQFSFKEAAERMPLYLKDRGYTHVELLPIYEYPLDESAGYLTEGFFAPSSRFGKPQDLAEFTEKCHEQGIGVIVTSMPAHFPMNSNGLELYDGSELYGAKGQVHSKWHTKRFDFSKPQVRSFLLSSVLHSLEYYNGDGIRINSVSEIIRSWNSETSTEQVTSEMELTNSKNQDSEAVAFLQQLSQELHQKYPDRLLIAEDTSAFPRITSAIEAGGLGFDLVWNRGWEYDLIQFLRIDDRQRNDLPNPLQISLPFAFREKYVLPLTHSSNLLEAETLLAGFHGNIAERFAQARLVFAYLFAYPGKKLHFMGYEFGEKSPWQPNQTLHWEALRSPHPFSLHQSVWDLNRLYLKNRALHELDSSPETMQWVNSNEKTSPVLAFIRRIPGPSETTSFFICVFNFSSKPVLDYMLGVPDEGFYEEVYNSDSEHYGGANIGSMGGRYAETIGRHGFPYSIAVQIGAYSACFLRHSPEELL